MLRPRRREAVANGWLIFFGLLWAYLLLIFWLVRSGKMRAWNLSLAFGFVLMIRTERGKGTLDWLGRAKRFWAVFGDVGIGVVLLVMAGFTFLMFLTIGPSLSSESNLRPATASEVFAIPGVNPFIPLWYGLLGLIVTLIVHEGGHGVLARANGLKVKSLGLLYAIVPIGAFVEPDEDEIKEATLRQRLRVFSAGPMVNIVVGLAVVLAFGALIGAATPLAGAAIPAVSADGPADMAGLLPGDSILAVNGAPIDGADHLGTVLDGYAPGNNVTITTSRGDHVATLTDRWSSWSEEAKAEVQAWTEDAQALCQHLYPGVEDWGACADAATQDAMLGVEIFDTSGRLDALSAPLGSGLNFLQVIQLPIEDFLQAPVLSSYLPTFTEAPFQEDTYWILVNCLFWIFWLNVLVGAFNALPMLPLDGGHIFRDAVAGVVQKVRPGISRETRDRIVGKAALLASLSIFAIILITIFGPRLSPLWA